MDNLLFIYRKPYSKDGQNCAVAKIYFDIISVSKTLSKSVIDQNIIEEFTYQQSKSKQTQCIF